MKESDYCLASNLAKLRIANSAMRDCFGLSEKEMALLLSAVTTTDKLIGKLEAQVDKRVEADE